MNLFVPKDVATKMHSAWVSPIAQNPVNWIHAVPEKGQYIHIAKIIEKYIKVLTFKITVDSKNEYKINEKGS